MFGKFHSKSLVFITLGFLTLLSCRKFEHTNPLDPDYEGPTPTKIKEEVVNIQESPNVTLSDSSNGIFVFTYSGSTPNIDKGSVLVGTEGRGYIRRVTGVNILDQNRISYQTEQGCLTDVFVSTDFDTSLILDISKGEPSLFKSMSGIRIDQNGHIHLENLVLFEGNIQGASIKVTIPNGIIKFKPGFDIGLIIDFTGVSYFITEANGTIEFDCDIVLEASKEIEYNHEIRTRFSK